MIIIGEKINGTRKRVGQAVIQRNKAFIQDLAIRQAQAGSSYLDINAGTNPDREAEDLVWLIETVQEVTDVPLCLDSPNPGTLAAGLAVVNQTPMINSISGEPGRIEGILPLVEAHQCQVIALCLDERGIPDNSQARFEVIEKIIGITRDKGIPDSQLFIDPLAMSLATDTNGANTTLETMQLIRKGFPETHFTIGLSNISFGLPARKFINQVFLSLAIANGLDSVILDPLNVEILQTILTTNLVLGLDRYAQQYSKAFRAGMFK